jgi:hypothetical protein
VRDLLTKQYASLADKAIFVELLAEGSPLHTSVSTKANLDTWISNFKIAFTTLRDPDGVGQRIIKDFSPREYTFVVELATMKVLYKGYGYSKVQGAFDLLKTL